MKIKFKKLREDAIIPRYAHPGDAGMDVTAVEMEYDMKHDCFIYHTGIACETEPGYAVLCMPRSSNSKTDAYLCNGIGLVDSATYRGEIQFRYKNRNNTNFNAIGLNDGCVTMDASTGIIQIDSRIKQYVDIIVDNAKPYDVGDRIGQLVVIKLPDVEVEETDTLSDTTRGTGGFGSTGK